MAQPAKKDSFLAEAVTPKHKHLSYQDGFRFGVGFFIGNLFLAVLFGGLVWLGLLLTGRL